LLRIIVHFLDFGKLRFKKQACFKVPLSGRTPGIGFHVPGRCACDVEPERSASPLSFNLSVGKI
jgi:hypothetical protein